MNKERIHKGMLFMLVLPILFFVQDECWKIKLFSFDFADRTNPFNELVAGACLLLWGSSLIFQGRNSPFRQRQYRTIVLGFFASVSISYLLGSTVIYHQDPWRVWRVMFWFSGLTMYFYLMRTGGYPEMALKVFRILMIYGFGAAIFSVLVAYTPPLAALLLKPEDISVRFGMVRFIVFEDGVALIYFFFLSRFLVARKLKTGSSGSLWNWIGIVFSWFCLIMTGLSRQRIASVTVVTVGMAMLALFLPGFRKQVSLWVILLGFVVVTMAVGLSNFMDAFNSSLDMSRQGLKNADNMSVYVRQKGMKFYFDQFVQTGYIGIGWISSTGKTTYNNEIVKANLSGMKLVDLGIFEVIFRYGILGLLIYARFLWVALRQVNFLSRHGDDMTRVIAVTVGMFLTAKLVSVNTIFFFPAHCLFYAVLMYVLDTMYQSLRHNVNAPAASGNAAFVRV
jgi:hypothetical protein